MPCIDDGVNSIRITIRSADSVLTSELLLAIVKIIREHPNKEEYTVEVTSSISVKKIPQVNSVADTATESVRETIDEWAKLCGFRNWMQVSHASGIPRSTLYNWIGNGHITKNGLQKLNRCSTTEEAREFITKFQTKV